MGTHLHGDDEGDVMLNNYFDADTGHLSTQCVVMTLHVKHMHTCITQQTYMLHVLIVILMVMVS